MKHDWIVSQMLSPDFPFNVKQNDQYYLDCDAASFRLILAIIQGEAKVNLEAARLSSTDLELLKATARFLLW